MSRPESFITQHNTGVEQFAQSHTGCGSPERPPPLFLPLPAVFPPPSPFHYPWGTITLTYTLIAFSFHSYKNCRTKIGQQTTNTEPSPTQPFIARVLLQSSPQAPDKGTKASQKLILALKDQNVQTSLQFLINENKPPFDNWTEISLAHFISCLY